MRFLEKNAVFDWFNVVVFATAFLALLVTMGCQQLPVGCRLECGFDLAGQPPTAGQAKAWRTKNNPVLINGEPVEKSKYPHVVRIFAGSSSCTASIVGPRAILTAAHCADTGDTVKFQTHDGKNYTAKITRNPGYPNQDKDHALGLINTAVGVKPVAVRTDRFEKKGMEVLMIGYGCTKPGGGGGNDGVLRAGRSKISGGQGYDLVLEMPGEAALCYGDSGGPLHYSNNGVLEQIAVNSKGNIEDKSYCTRTTLPETSDFLKSWSEKNQAGICGVTINCGSQEPPPGPKSFQFENEYIKLEGLVK